MSDPEDVFFRLDPDPLEDVALALMDPLEDVALALMDLIRARKGQCRVQAVSGELCDYHRHDDHAPRCGWKVAK